MSDLARKLPEVSVEWGAERESRVLAAMHRRRVRRARARAAVVVALSCAVVAALFVSVRASLWPPAARSPAVAVSASSLRVLLADGSVAERLDDRTRLTVVEDRASLSVLELETGGARFDVKHDPSRPFRVRAGSVLVEVLGTAFTVTRADGKVTTTVERGHVRVTRGGERVELTAGSAITLTESAPAPPAPPASLTPPARESPPTPALEPPPTPAPEPTPALAPAPAPQVPAEDWAALARAGEYDRAYGAMKSAPAPRREDPADLLLAADVARLSGHSAEAVAPLRRLVDQHAGDARAPLAAFTLGRVLLDEVGRPGEAAAMFARARSLAPDGPLAEDALAREVEAWWRGGDTDQARARAAEYVRLFPAGARLKSVRRFGGLE